MILAAGAGTRLGSITHDLPKALVRVGGKPLLGWVVERMAECGIRRIIVNTHHHHEMIRDYLGSAEHPGIEFVLSPEPEGPYETGGGVFRAGSLFLKTTPFLLHNADVLSTIDLGSLINRHQRAKEGSTPPPIASLAVQKRDSRRALLFDDLGLLGWENRGSDRARTGRVQARDPAGEVYRRSFTGIHVVEPSIFGLSDRQGSFSIISVYLDLAAKGWSINPLDVSNDEWFDIGTPQRLEEARARFRSTC